MKKLFQTLIICGTYTKITSLWTSLVILWLRFCTCNVGVMGLILGRGTKILIMADKEGRKILSGKTWMVLTMLCLMWGGVIYMFILFIIL